jgi:uncharacterized protein involved in response to NO
MFGVSHWLLYALGLVPEYSAVYHSSVQTQLYVSLFIFGFLTTAAPRFAGAPPATPRETGVFLFLFSALFLGLAFHAWMLSDAIFCLLLLNLFLFLVRRIRKSGYRPPAEFVWVPAGILCGFAGAALSIAARAGWVSQQVLAAGKGMKEQGFVLFVVLGIGGFLGPRLMGFPGLLDPSKIRSAAEGQKRRRRRVLIHLAAALGLIASFALEGSGSPRAAYGLRALLVSGEILWTASIYRFPAAAEVFARILWHALWMVVLGYWACAVWPGQIKALLHLVFIGGFSLMILAVATMVILNHAGESEKLRGPSWTLRIAATGLWIALAFRVAAVFFPADYFTVLGVAAAFWLMAGVCWLGLVAPRLTRRAETGEDSC